MCVSQNYWRVSSTQVYLDNNSTVGTTQYGPVKGVSGTNPLQVTGTLAGDTEALGICIDGCGATGKSIIQILGMVLCNFDNATTSQDYVVVSSISAHSCRSAGATRPTSGRILGRAITTSASPSQNWMIMFGIGVDGFSISTGSSLPSGMVTMILSGTCPSGFTEVSALNGKMLRGTLATNANVGTTGGSTTITPAGTVTAPTFTGSSATTSAVSAGTPAGTNSSPTFTGTALANHAHELPIQIPSTTTTRQIAVAAFGTGTSRAATAVSTTGTANTTSAAVALTQPVSAGTPAGTVTAPTFTGSAMGTHTHTLTATGTNSVPTFIGSVVDPSPLFTRVIFCSAN